jgi:hypothetical protein
MTGRPAHLVARFFGSLVPRRVNAADEAWVQSLLTPPEQSLWAKLPRADKVESLAVARRADAALACDVQHRGDYLAAALLHDVGKLDADFGPFRRAAATALGAVGGRGKLGAWKQHRGFLRRTALYLDHAALGAQRVVVSGGRERAAQWAAAHHDPTAWPTADIPVDVCRVLAAADGERVG